MLKVICIALLVVVITITLMSIAIVAMEHHHWDACADLLSKMKFAPSAHTPTGC